MPSKSANLLRKVSGRICIGRWERARIVDAARNCTITPSSSTSIFHSTTIYTYIFIYIYIYIYIYTHVYTFKCILVSLQASLTHAYVHLVVDHPLLTNTYTYTQARFGGCLRCGRRQICPAHTSSQPSSASYCKLKTGLEPLFEDHFNPL